MISDSLFLSGRNWFWPGLIFAAITLLILLWSCYRARNWSVGIVSIPIKMLGVALLLYCLLEPLVSRETAKPGANLFVELVDNSKGMQIKDRGQTQSRGELLKTFLDEPWQKNLAENFQVRRYLFGARLQSTPDFGGLKFDGSSSALVAALRGLAGRFEGQPLAGILLFTDGNATDFTDGSLDLSGVPPIYPVVSGKDEPVKDISLRRVSMSRTLFEDAPVTIQAEVNAAGFRGETVSAQLLDENGAEVEVQTRTPQEDDESLTFRFQTRPLKSGVCFYQVRVAPKKELAGLTNENQTTRGASSEATLANNICLVPVERERGPYRILYVSGRPNWEFKFLNRALMEDDQIQISALVRIAKREPKFDFQAGGTSHPFFAGADGAEEVERYDQPVLVRLNTKDELELSGGFPKTETALYAYDAIILDDLESQFFTQDQMALIKKFVSERGSLLMLGGAESFHQGNYERTPIGDLLPVYLDGVEPAVSGSDLRLALTKEGWLQPWARLRKVENEEQKRLDAMPAFAVMNRVRQIKPGGSVIATVQDTGGRSHPALVVQRFGRGRVGALMIGDFWRWGLRDAEAHNDMDKAWRQTIRWLIADGPRRIEFTAEESASEMGESVSLRARVYDQKFQALDNATVNVAVRFVGVSNRGTGTIEAADSPETIHLSAEPSAKEAGLYQVAYIPRESGGYLAEAIVKDEKGSEIGRAQTGWAVDPDAREFATIKPNRSLLESIAKKTGGEVIEANRLHEFAQRLPSRAAPIREVKTSPAWHQSWLFAFALGCFALEWGVRRWKGLP